jgi:hypothetical protein
MERKVMTQEPLFLNTYREAMVSAILALGGYKRVGAMLWPSKEADVAGDCLAKCLNPKKREKLSPDELALIRRECRRQNVHVLATWEMRDAGYADPQPIEPEDERASLMREFVQAQKGFQALAAKMERAGLKVVA